jgi:hypothetical protein
LVRELERDLPVAVWLGRIKRPERPGNDETCHLAVLVRISNLGLLAVIAAEDR